MEQSGKLTGWGRTVALVILTIITVLCLLDTLPGELFSLENLILITCNFR